MKKQTMAQWIELTQIPLITQKPDKCTGWKGCSNASYSGNMSGSGNNNFNNKTDFEAICLWSSLCTKLTFWTH